MLDREVELRRVQDVVAGARQGAGQVLLIEGPIGSGRTSLLRAAGDIAAADGMVVLTATGALAERDFDGAVAGQVLDPLDPAVSAPGGPEWIHAQQERLETVAAETAVAVLVDDAQWADPPSLRWLAHLAARARRLPVLLAVSTLAGDRGAGQPLLRRIGADATTLPCRALCLDAVRDMVRNRFGAAGEPEFVEACLEVGAGRPLLLDAVLADVAAAGGRPLAAQAHTVRAARPGALRLRFVHSLREQDAPGRAVLRALAVLGPGAGAEPLRRLAEVDARTLREILHGLLRQGILTDVDEPRFVHPGLREVVAGSGSGCDAWHARAATVLRELGRPAVAVADHLVEAGGVPDDWAFDLLRDAARQATSTGQPGQAARYLRRALQHPGRNGPERGALLVDLASTVLDTEPDQAVRHIGQALPLLPSTADRAAALALIDPTRLRTAPAAVRTAVPLVARALGEPAADRLGDASEPQLRMLSRLRLLEPDGPAALTSAGAQLGESGAAHEAMTGTPAGRELLTVLLRAAVLSGARPAGAAADLAERVLGAACAAGPTGGMPAAGLGQVLVLVLVAADRPDRLVRLLPDGPGDPAEPFAREQLLIDMARGRVGEVQARPAPAPTPVDRATAFDAAVIAAAIEARHRELAGSASGSGPVRDPVGQAIREMSRVAEAVGRGEWDIALARVLGAGSRLEQLGWSNPALFPWRSWAASLHARRHDRRAALALAEDELALAQAWGAPAALGRALRLRGSLIGGAAGGSALRAAVDVLGTSANRLELARAEIGLGRHLLDDDDPVGHDLLARGRQRAERLGAHWLCGPSGPSGTVEVSGPALLTEAERRVAELAAGGATNPLIAEQLGVGVRAVEKHLTNTYRKLGIRGRRSLRAVLPSATS